MSLPLVLGLAAEREFDAAADWYQQQAGLGVKFVKYVRDALNRISRSPELYGIVHQNVRCTRVRRFPYNIFYRIQTDRIEVVAILHAHRDPAIWKARG
jgi:plasmid stabilization system protein ParE